MSTEAIIMMVVAVLVIWGGLAAAIINLSRSDRPVSVDDVHRDL